MELFRDITEALSWVPYALALYISFFLAKSSWMFWHQMKFKLAMNWVLLEIRVPRETTRGPKAMEQVLASVYNLKNDPVGPKETYLDGEITRWFSLEIVGSRKGTRLYLRLLRPQLHPFLASFYAQYPDVEIIEADHDYIYEGPLTYHEMKKNKYEIYALELQQARNPGYSLNTYVDFEPKVGDEKGRILDTMAGIVEIIGKLKPDETCWIQFLCQPDAYNRWWPDADSIVKKFKEATQEGEHGGDTGPIRFRFRTQEEEKTLKRTEEKKGKAAYYTMVRMVYFAPRSIYNHDLPNRGLFGWMTQFSNERQKLIKVDKVRTKVEWEGFPFLFPRKRLYWKGATLYQHYRDRFIPEETIVGKIFQSHPLSLCFFHKPVIFSVEELATFFHVPTNVVLTQVTMDRIESKRLSPPSGLPG